MNITVTELSVSAQTAYGQLFEAALNAEHVRSVADLNGSFNAKTVKGRKYWYFQYFDAAGALRQVYVGPDSERVRALVEKAGKPAGVAALGPLARSASSLGCATVARKHGRVLRRLGEYGFFRAGGVLIGTHAFLAYGNLLGVRWGSHNLTQDLDFAHAGKSLALALPGNLQVRTDDAISSLDMGFLPIVGLGGKTGGGFLNPNEPEFRLDFLTTLHRGGTTPFLHPQLQVTLQPLRFMEFSLQAVEQAVVFSTEHVVLVNVPEPARFALHKLLVYGERTGAFRLKAAKDLAQAAHLIAWLWPNRQDALLLAVDDLQQRGKGWTSRFRTGVAALGKAYPELLAERALARALSGK
jgi:hypothetical protein